MAEFLTMLVVVAVVVVGFLLFVWLPRRRNNEVVECGSCGNRMTFGAFKRRDGCPRCGSDLFNRTGQQAG